MARKQDTIQLELFLDFVPQPKKSKGMSEAAKQKLREANLGKVMSVTARQKVREHRLGKKWSDDMKEKFRQSHLGLATGDKNPNWKGGRAALRCKLCQTTFYVRPYMREKAKYCCIACLKADPDKKSTLSRRIRSSAEYKVWRRAVFERDDYTCQMCQTRGGKLQADHIKAFALYPELRLDINNGRTLCLSCHVTTENFGMHSTRQLRLLSQQQADALQGE
jgi:5-methylcytosine-specific restriction endonuclease McrA